MAKATKSMGVSKFTPKTKKKGSAFKQSGPKATKTKPSVGQGKKR
jgi:hypothetical protein